VRGLLQEADAYDGNMALVLDVGGGYIKVVGYACILVFNGAKASERCVVLGHAWSPLFRPFPSREEAYAWLLDALGRRAVAKWSGMPHDEDCKLVLHQKSGVGAVVGPEVTDCSTKQMCCYCLSATDGRARVGDVLRPWDGKPFAYDGPRLW
jgi:hypothetical protein